MLKGLQYRQSRVPEVLPRLCNLSGRGEQSQTTAVEQDKKLLQGANSTQKETVGRNTHGGMEIQALICSVLERGFFLLLMELAFSLFCGPGG